MRYEGLGKMVGGQQRVEDKNRLVSRVDSKEACTKPGGRQAVAEEQWNDDGVLAVWQMSGSALKTGQVTQSIRLRRSTL